MVPSMRPCHWCVELLLLIDLGTGEILLLLKSLQLGLVLPCWCCWLPSRSNVMVLLISITIGVVSTTTATGLFAGAVIVVNMNMLKTTQC